MYTLVVIIVGSLRVAARYKVLIIRCVYIVCNPTGYDEEGAYQMCSIVYLSVLDCVAIISLLSWPHTPDTFRLPKIWSSCHICDASLPKSVSNRQVVSDVWGPDSILTCTPGSQLFCQKQKWCKIGSGDEKNGREIIFKFYSLQNSNNYYIWKGTWPFARIFPTLFYR